MAKVAGPLYSERAVGKFAGALVYNQWRGINYCKRLTAPALKRTVRQLLVRSYIQQLSQLWQSISLASRTDWQIWADANQPNDPQFGRPIPWSGYNAFVGLNCRMLDTVGTTILAPPSIVSPNAPAALAASVLLDAITVTWTPYVAATVLLDLWSWVHPSPVRNPNSPLFKHYAYADGDAGNLAIPTATVGTWYFMARAVDGANGQASTFLRCQVTVTP